MKHFSRNIVARAYFPNDFQFSIRKHCVQCPSCKLWLRYTAGNFNDNSSMRAVAKILRARASEHSFASTVKLNGTIRYPFQRTPEHAPSHHHLIATNISCQPIAATSLRFPRQATRMSGRRGGLCTRGLSESVLLRISLRSARASGAEGAS